MAYCEKCGKETKDGQIFCESCLAEMEDNSFNDLFQSLDKPEESDTSDNSADDDFNKILEELQGPREEIEEQAKEQKEKQDNGPSTVSDVFSDAVSAISSLEDELEDMVNLGEPKEITEEVQEEKQGFFARLFGRFKKKESVDNQTSLAKDGSGEERPMTKKEIKKAKKEEAKRLKLEQAKKKQEEAQKLKEEKLAAKKAKAEKKADPKKAKNDKKADAKKAKPKKEKPKKEKKEKVKKPKVEEEIIVEDLGHFNVPVFIIVMAVFICGTGYLVIKSLSQSYNYSIEVASRKFDHQQYDQAFEEIYGLDVKEDDEELYDKIMTVMYVNKQLNSYNNYMGLELYPEALDSLIKGLKRYEKYIDFASQLGISEDLDYVRDQILEELKREFKLSEKKAMKLTKIDDMTEYSIDIYDIVLENTDYGKK